MAPGDLIDDKYAVVQPIGTGGMGIVYEARHARLGQRVAVKMLLPDLAESMDAVARFEREARAAAHLRSPHVAKVFDVDTLPDGTPYIVMELLEGRDLADELAARGPLPVAEAVDYLLEACDAMAEAHLVGIVHRDLKPANMFLANDGRRTIVKVLDFGISKILDEEAPGVTTTRSGLGTANYMSPEHVRSAKHVDARGDVWALGVVLYEMLTGAQPFPGDTTTAVAAAIVADPPIPLRSLREDVPIALEHVLMTALEKDRDRRFADAAVFGAAIAPFGSRRITPSSAPGARSREPVTPGVDPTLHSAVGVDLPAASGTRSPAWAHPRNFWIPVGFLVGLFASAAFVREVTREATTSSVPASVPAPLAPTPAATERGTNDPGEGVGARAAEIATVDRPVVERPDEAIHAPPAASVQSLPAIPVARPSRPGSSAAPAPLSRPAIVKEPVGTPSSTRAGGAQKIPHGLPPDPG